MKTSVVLDALIIGCCVLLIFIPFDTKRIREHWAKLIFILCGIIGTGKGIFCLTWDLGGVSFSRRLSLQLDGWLYHFIDGVIFGLLVGLIISGQLLGKKHPLNNALEPRPTAL